MKKHKFSTSVLVKTLASFEAVRLPIRDKWEACGAIYAARAAPPPVGGGNHVERQEICRARLDLASAGLMVGHALTQEGRCLARQLTWPFTPNDLRRAVRRLREALDRRDFFLGCGDVKFVPEQILAGSIEISPRAHLQACIVPALSDGWLTSASSSVGEVAFGMSDEAVDLAAAVKASVGTRSKLDDEMIAVYVKTFARVRRLVLSDRTRHQELGEIPEFFDELQSGREYDDFTGITPILSTKETESCT